MKKPNLLFILSDQHRFCDLGCCGNPHVATPNLDALARSGVQLDHFYSNCPLCVPARGTLLTGTYPLKHRAAANDLPLDPSRETLATVLKRGGYATAYIGKWHLAGIPRDQAVPPEQRPGIDYWRGCNCNHDYYHAWYDDDSNTRHFIDGYEPTAQTDLALEYLDRPAGEQPWALFLCYGTPHQPYQLVPPEFYQRYARQDPPFRENLRAPACLSPDRLVDEAALREWYRGYYAHITALDTELGRVFDLLTRRNLWDDTIVIYTSDHGDMLGSHGLTNKQWPHEESVHVPFLLRYGSRWTGRRSQLMSLVDVAPTLAALTGTAFSQPVDGRDRAEIFRDGTAPGAESVYLFDLIPCHQAHDRQSPEWRAVRDLRYTYAKTPYEDGWLLFDNETDPLQLQNRVDDPRLSDVRSRLDRMLDRHIAQNDALLPWPRLIEEFGLKEAWNKSQAYFHYPLLP